MLYRITFLALIIVGVFAGEAFPPALIPFRGERVGGNSSSVSSWLWGSPSSFTPAQMQKMFTFCQQYGIKTVYLEIDNYLSINNIANPTIKHIKLIAYNAAVTKFLTTAARYGVRVQGLGGEIYWANSPSNSLPPVLLKYVLDYNNSHLPPAQFEGMQYDIEFYNLSDFPINKVIYSINYLSLIQNLIKQVKADQIAVTSKFQLGFATPFWFSAEGVIPQITWSGQTKPLAYHILDLLNTSPGSYDALMDYRNYASGTDGSIANAKNEMDYAQQSAPNASVVVGQDTTNSQPSKTTFYGLGKTALNTQTAAIRVAFASYSVFKGIAIHDLPGYLAL